MRMLVYPFSRHLQIHPTNQLRYTLSYPSTIATADSRWHVGARPKWQNN